VQKGYTLFVNGDPEPAIAYFTAALKMNSHDVNARRYLAHACVQTGRYDDASKQYEILQNIVGPQQATRIALEGTRLFPSEYKHFNQVSTVASKNRKTKTM
jgi:hypothetical protein